METPTPTSFLKTQTPLKLTIDTTELADALSISRPFAYQLINREDFPKSFRIGRKRLHSVDAVRAWIAEQIEKQE